MAAKKDQQPKGHHDSYSYPSATQFQESLPHVLAIVTGASDLDLNGKAKTLHTVGSFALGMALPHEGGGLVHGEDPKALEGNEDLAKLNDEAVKQFPQAKGAAVKGAWNWGAIWLLIRSLIDGLIS